ncbi:hypothetical protein [Actinoplanes solisilvae]|uniref:hypothetical protein n=1 Tax=Actinoplanes solisilvae TaxID=2486853 RepID=UPI000FD814EB|nr:hypothetical protein [Actinoplanes solisilvae]
MRKVQSEARFRAPQPRSRPPRKKWILAPVAALAVAAALVAVPWGKDDGRAYATWTPIPVALTPAEIDLVGSACRKDMRRYDLLDLDRAHLVLAERRGEYVAMLYRTEGPDMVATCLAHNLPGTDDVEDLNTGAASGSDSPRTTPAGRFEDGALTDDGAVSITEGTVGPDVAGLTVHAGTLTVQATVSNGRWVAWWPGPAVEWVGQAQTRDLMTYDLTLRDGSVIRDAKPWRG